jgi:hypothetical protein
MSSWGTKRRNLIITIFLIAIFIILATVGYVLLDKDPTCFDGRQNGSERGVDCGGGCELLCSGQALEPLIRWSRYFEVAPGLYNAVAYIENQNPDAGTQRADYIFTLYDRENTVLAEKTGSIELRPAEVIPIVENGLVTGQLRPTRITFEITNDLVWKRQAPVERVIRVKDERRTSVEGAPRITAILENTGFDIVSDLEAVVIVYDTNGNAIGSSSTIVSEIYPNSTASVLFTWPQGFSGEVVRFEIIPLYDF